MCLKLNSITTNEELFMHFFLQIIYVITHNNWGIPHFQNLHEVFIWNNITLAKTILLHYKTYKNTKYNTYDSLVAF